MDPIEQRLQSLERTTSDLRVDVATLDTKLDAHAAASSAAQQVINSKLDVLVSQLEPLRERSWKQAGASTVWGLFGGALISLLGILVRFWK